ncbi:MAG: heparinase II/III family protein [Proteobacteria bacterium]|nr:heparinase II/III family protein [Pseudomonadota bacterium]
MTPAKLKWYAARLAAMSPPEVLHRVREAGKKRAYRSDTRGWPQFDGAGSRLADLAFLRTRLATGADAGREALAVFEAGRITGLGQEMAAEMPGLWFHDPVSGTAWPGAERYCFDVDVRTTGVGRGDVKFVWEVNRLQFLHPLCAAVAQSPDPARINRLFAVLAAWAEANPPFRGVNWFSGIELAMRMVTFTLVVAAVPANRLSEDQTFLLNRLIAAHAFWLERYPSRYSSANNHLVAEGLGLLLAGLIAPDAPHAAQYEAEGRAILEGEAALQIFKDGVGGEQSPTYQAFTMEMLAFGALVAAGLGRPLVPTVSDRLIAGARFLQCLMDEAGQCPKIGDDDEGRVIGAPPDREPRYTASIVAAVAGLTEMPALLPPAHDAHLRDAIFAVPASASRATDGLHVFADGGYSVARREIARRQTVLTFDHGPLGYLALAAHGHADALGVWLSINGEQVLIDAGTYLYHSGGALRNALRASPAHNTLVIDGQSQSLPSSAFSWSRRTDARLVEAAPCQVTGAHDGYRSRFGATHRRCIRHVADGYVIADSLTGAAGALPVAISFLVSRLVTVEQADGAALCHLHGLPVMRLAPPEGFTIRLVTGERATGRGLASEAFGQVGEATQIVFSGALGDGVAETRLTVLPRD